MKAFITTFHWEDLLTASEDAPLVSKDWPMISTHEGVMTVSTKEWARSFPPDRLIHVETRVVDL